MGIAIAGVAAGQGAALARRRDAAQVAAPAVAITTGGAAAAPALTLRWRQCHRPAADMRPGGVLAAPGPAAQHCCAVDPQLSPQRPFSKSGYAPFVFKCKCTCKSKACRALTAVASCRA